MNVELICEVVGVKGILVIVIFLICIFVLCDEYLEVLNVDNKGLCDYIELVICWLWCKLDEGKMLLLKLLLLKVVYYILCYMEKMGWMFYILELLCKILGFELMVLDFQCCGIVGIYGFKKENYFIL